MGMSEETARLHAHIAFLETQLKRYQSQEDALVRALSQAQLTANDITADAKKQAGKLLNDSDMVIRDARRITANARAIMEQAELEGQQRLLSARVEADKLLFDTQMYAERMRKETENHVRMRLSELQRLVEDSQRTLESSRTRMAYIIRENMDNIRVFMGKIAQLRNDSQDEALKASLNQSLRQMQEFLDVFHNDDRMIPAPVRVDSLIQPPAKPAQASAPDDDERVWTVEDVMRTVEKSGLSAPAIPGPAGELLTNAELDQLPVLPGLGPAPQAKTPETQPSAAPKTQPDAQADTKLDELVDEALSHTLIRDEKPAYEPKAPYSVDEKLDDIISRMMTPEQKAGQPAAQPTPKAPQSTPPPQAYGLVYPQSRAQTPPQPPAPPRLPYGSGYQKPNVQPPQAQPPNAPQPKGYGAGSAPRADFFMEGLQLRRGGHSSLSTDTECGEQAGFIQADPGTDIRKEPAEKLPDDFEL